METTPPLPYAVLSPNSGLADARYIVIARCLDRVGAQALAKARTRELGFETQVWRLWGTEEASNTDRYRAEESPKKGTSR